MKKYTLLLFLFVFASATIYAQRDSTFTADEISTLKSVAAAFKGHEGILKTMTSWWLLLCLLIPSLTAFGAYQYFKKTLEDKALEVISQKLGISLEGLKDVVNIHAKRLEAAKNRIALIGTLDKNALLITTLKNAKFSTADYFSWSKFTTSFNSNAYEVLVFDDLKNDLNSSDVLKVIQQHKAGFKFVLLTSKDLSTADFNAFKDLDTKVIKMPERLADTIFALYGASS